MDKKVVSLLSTIQPCDNLSTVLQGLDQLAMEYNNTMGGVDRRNQHLTNNPKIKKRQEVLQKIFFHLLVEEYPPLVEEYPPLVEEYLLFHLYSIIME
ncbi:hypothetical protein TNCT_604551 [Trichonephila clavata]|uniref:Uncharacterized protein n=1 Tax=Trichonephila clavata TaxID=2740835 RepID=A0A8X6KWX0_TRICU|nr:hypothetical protein TNCT_604551 [Trichonephila clavata]